MAQVLRAWRNGAGFPRGVVALGAGPEGLCSFTPPAALPGISPSGGEISHVNGGAYPARLQGLPMLPQ
ncbi:hypothetical protein C8K44_107284 [Aminobacter sp. AP02]|nr:hypothetical protein C8K44_107284 [Aminobacter sp. AP02]